MSADGAGVLAPPPPAAPPARRRVSRPVLAHGAVLAAAIGCWVAALAGTDLSRISGYGLLTALPLPYYVAPALLTGGFTAAVAARPVRPVLLGAYVVALIAVLHCTTPLLYPEPRYAWTYKHLGVIDYLARHGGADRSVDVYQNWPGFFALNAWFSKATGIAPIDYAAWAQPAFELANVAAILFALRGVTRHAHLRWVAVWLFVVANWLGQDYLSPQAFGFLLVEVALGLAIRGTPPRRGPPGEPALGPRTALVAGGLCALAVVVSHQLSPVVLIVSLAALRALTGRPPAWVVAALVAVEAGWLYLSYDFVAAHFRIFDVSVATSARAGGAGLPGVALGAALSRAAVILMAALAGVGLLRRWRAGHRDVTAAALAGAPALVVGLQAYGGEAPLRAYLFALPWLSFFAAAACVPGGPARDGARLRDAWRLPAATALLGAGTLFGYFGQELLNYIAPADVAVSRWFLRHAPAEASLTLVAPNFPDRLDARYALHLDSPPALTAAHGFRPHRLGPGDVGPLSALLRRDHAPAKFVALTPSQARYARFYGIAPAGSFPRLARALRASPDFRLVYRRAGGYLFEYRPRR